MDHAIANAMKIYFRAHELQGMSKELGIWFRRIAFDSSSPKDIFMFALTETNKHPAANMHFI